MPYIKQEDRKFLDEKLLPDSAGELNYCIHVLLERYLGVAGENYQSYNDIIGALGCVSMELYRRRVAFLENKKIKENGDISFYENF
jgi:hypothetical protein